MRSRAAHRLLRRRAASPASAGVPTIVNRVLSRPGQPLDATSRTHFEPRFGHDFARVRIHADAETGRSAAAVGPEAYAFGPNIAFAAGRHGPTTGAGRALLAHELAHVVQQPDAPSVARLGDPADPAERQAEGMAAAAVSGAGFFSPQKVEASGTIRRRPVRGFGDPDPAAAFQVSRANGSTFGGFAQNGAELTEDHKSQIADYKRRLSRLLSLWPDSRLTIVGYIAAGDAEAQRQHLGQRRADAVMAALGTGDAALPPGIMAASSVTEMAAEGDGQARPARVEVHFYARHSFQMPPMRQLQPGMPVPSFDFSRPPPGAGDERRVPSPHGAIPLTPPAGWSPLPRPDIGGSAAAASADIPGFRTSPAASGGACDNNWVADALTPLIRQLPPLLREKASAAVASLDEAALGGLIGLGPEGDYREPLKVVVKAGLQVIKCKKPDLKEPSMNDRIAPEPPDRMKAPGEFIPELTLEF